jgi:hypothetical protein
VIIFNNHLEYKLAEKMKVKSENRPSMKADETDKTLENLRNQELNMIYKHPKSRDLCQIMPSDAARPQVII